MKTCLNKLREAVFIQKLISWSKNGKMKNGFEIKFVKLNKEEEAAVAARETKS